jgi:glycosyltransferase involved in cell wall biosynthesis
VCGDGADLVPVGDADALGAALARVLDDEAHRSALVERGHAVVARHPWSATVDGLADLFARAAKEKTAP